MLLPEDSDSLLVRQQISARAKEKFSRHSSSITISLTKLLHQAVVRLFNFRPMWKEASKALVHSNSPLSAVRYLYRKSSITSPPGGGGLFTSNTFDGGRGGGLNRVRDLFNLAKTMVLILHKELEYKMAKAQVQEVGDHAAEDQKQIGTSS